MNTTIAAHLEQALILTFSLSTKELLSVRIPCGTSSEGDTLVPGCVHSASLVVGAQDSNEARVKL